MKCLLSHPTLVGVRKENGLWLRGLLSFERVVHQSSLLHMRDANVNQFGLGSLAINYWINHTLLVTILWLILHRLHLWVIIISSINRGIWLLIELHRINSFLPLLRFCFFFHLLLQPMYFSAKWKFGQSWRIIFCCCILGNIH